MSNSVYEMGIPFNGGVPYNVQFFNGFMWKNIERFIKGDKVLQYKGCGQAELVEPIKWRSCHTYRKPIDVSRKTEWGYEFPLFLYEGQEVLYWKDDKQVLYSFFLKEGVCPGRYNLVGSCSIIDNQGSINSTSSVRLVEMINSMVKEDLGKYVGNFQFSDLLYGLSKEDRLLLLTQLGIYDKYKQWEKNKAIDVKMPLPGMVTQVADLWNITISENCAWVDKTSNTISFGINPVITVPSIQPGNYLNDYEVKFGFVVPSGKLVLRSGGIIFVLGDMR